jgi:hypothetical protein
LFSGDPVDRTPETLTAHLGDSAGFLDASALMTSPMSEGLFQRGDPDEFF